MPFDEQSSAGLMRSARIQARVIFALLMREVMTRYGRHNIGFLWLFAEPMMFTLGVAALWTALLNVHGSSIPIIAFAVTGYSSVLLWRNMSGRCMHSIGPNLALMYHRNVKAIDIFLSRIILEFLGATMSFMTLSVLFVALEQMQGPEDMLMVMLGWMLLAWFGAALAMFLGGLSERSEIVEKIWHPISYLLFPLSGAGFLVEAMPESMQEIILYLPMIHGVEILRDGYFGSHFTPHYSIPYMVSVNLLLTLLALADIRTLGSRLSPE